MIMFIFTIECVFNWQDDRGKSIRVTAPQYFDFAMTWCQQRITNQEIFPTKFGDQFPFDYLINVKQIIEFIWVIICHIYHSHYVQIIGIVFIRCRNYDLCFMKMEKRAQCSRSATNDISSYFQFGREIQTFAT